MTHPRFHAQQLYADLDQLPDNVHAQVGALIAGIYNALLEEAKKGSPEDQILGTLTPIGDAMHPRVARALLGQLVIALGGFGK